ncbi:MAG: hypothetical protein IJH87_03335 [Atopobiaceae bacterium]|nr:hypothetical protein [Atopobiaceae bacterium]
MDYSRRSGESLRQRPATYDGRTGRSNRLQSAGSTPGYQLRRHNIRFNNRPSPRGFFARYDSRGFIALAALILVAFLLIFGIVGCVRGCADRNAERDRAANVNPIDERVAVGASDEISTLLVPLLNKADGYDWIAQHADEYDDAELIRLLAREPATLDFVRAYPSAEKTAQPYGSELQPGESPLLYNWDTRWGNVQYAGHPLAVTGSGPTVMSMAYMTLTGSTDRTPADMAALAAERSYDSSDEYTTAQLFLQEAGGMGLVCNQIEVSEDRIVNALNSGNLVICQLYPGSLTNEPHWILLVRVKENGSIEVHDPTSTIVSEREWDAATLTSVSANAYAIAKA